MWLDYIVYEVIMRNGKGYTARYNCWSLSVLSGMLSDIANYRKRGWFLEKISVSKCFANPIYRRYLTPSFCGIVKPGDSETETIDSDLPF